MCIFLTQTLQWKISMVTCRLSIADIDIRNSIVAYNFNCCNQTKWCEYMYPISGSISELVQGGTKVNLDKLSDWVKVLHPTQHPRH